MSRTGVSQVGILINTGGTANEQEGKREAKVMEERAIFHWLHMDMKNLL